MKKQKFDEELNEEEFRKDIKKVKDSDQAKKIASEEGVYISDGKWHNFLVGFFIISVIIGIFGLLYLAFNDHFKSNLNVLLEPNYNISSNIDNTYNNKFENKVENQYDFKPENNYTINVNNIIECPTL